MFKKLKNFYSRILIEAGLTILNFFIENKFINSLYVFKTDKSLKKNGYNYSSNKIIKKLKLKSRFQVYLEGDKLYKVKLKNVA